MMVQMIPNVAIIKGTVATIENYPPQEGFCLVVLLIADAQEKDNKQFLGADLTGKEAKILLSEILRKKLNLQPSILVKGEIKKITPELWRAIEESWQLSGPLKKSSRNPPKK
jgi:hypothetical protein